MQMTSLIQQFYSTERFIAKAGATADAVQFIHINKPVTPEEGQQLIRLGQPVGVRTLPDGGEEYYLNDVTQGEFDVRIVAGSTLPASRTERLQLALQLRKQNDIDQLEMLKAADWPKPEEVIARMKAEMMANMQAMAAAQQSAAPQPTDQPMQDRQIFNGSPEESYPETVGAPG